MRRPIRNYLLCFTIRYRRLLLAIGTLVGESSSSGSLAIFAAIRRAEAAAWPGRFQHSLISMLTT